MKFLMTGVRATFLFGVLLGSIQAEASIDEYFKETQFSAADWATGFHLNAGLGVNAAYFDSDILRDEAGVGLTIHTDVGYYFLNAYSVDISTNVMLNRVKRILVWDTLGTIGLRVRLPAYLGPEKATPFLRVVGGKGPSVFIYNGASASKLQLEGERTHVEGEIYGLAYGIFEDAKDKTTWFTELRATGHVYRHFESIVEKDQVPITVSSEPVQRKAGMYALSLAFGIVLY